MCGEYCEQLGLKFNPKKSRILVFSKSRVDLTSFKPIYLDGDKIEYATTVKYLGVTIVSDHGFCFSAKEDIHSFYCASNSILNVLRKPDEDVLMHLLMTNCIPILSYACSVKNFSASDMRECNTAMNNAIRKVFTFHRWESIRTLREGFGLKSVYEIFADANKTFLKNLIYHHNSVLHTICNHLSVE